MVAALDSAEERWIPVVFFNDTATTEIYTLSRHDALPICDRDRALQLEADAIRTRNQIAASGARDRKSTRLNSSHANISYAVFCLATKSSYPRLAARSTSSTPGFKTRRSLVCLPIHPIF